MPSNGGAPAHVVVDSSGRNVIVANYNGGSVTVFPILTNGSWACHGACPTSGTGPACALCTMDASNHFAFVCRQGPGPGPFLHLRSRRGHAYHQHDLVLRGARLGTPAHDLRSAIPAGLCDLRTFIHHHRVQLRRDQRGPDPLPDREHFAAGGIQRRNTTAEIVVHPSGKFVYGSNRGNNTIAVFSVDAADGTLTPVQQQPTGRTPRNFAIDPTGAFCIVAGQDSSDIRLYTIDPENGQLTDTGKKLTVASPVCIVPFILSPPQPVITVRPTSTNTAEFNLGNTLSMLTYQVYRAPVLSSGTTTWDLLATGDPGQTSFVITNTAGQEYFQAGVLTNY